MLGVQLVARLLPHALGSRNIYTLLEQCDRHGPQHCALGGHFKFVWPSLPGDSSTLNERYHGPHIVL